MFTWAQVTESILSNSFDHLMCHLCKNSWEISWVESHKHVTVETHKSYVWLVQSASCLTCRIHSHLASLCTQTTSLTSLQLPHFAKRPGADRTLWRAGSGPRAACLSPLSQQKHRQRSASKRKNDLFRPSETHPAGTGPMRAEPDLWRVSTN